MHCPHCQQEHPSDTLYCPITGKKMPEEASFFPPREPVQPPGAPAPAQRARRGPRLVLAAGLVGLVILCGAVLFAMLRKVPTQKIFATLEAAQTAASQPASTARPVKTLPAVALAASPTAPVPDLPGRIAFETTRDGNLEIYVMNADGSGQANLSRDPAEDSDPSWSADGRNIAFTTNRDGNWEIYAMDAGGSHAANLSNNPADDAYPAWSPDGTKIAFTSNRDGNLEIYLMDADGSHPTRLTNSEAKDSFPAWSPDGQQIVFQSQQNNGGFDLYLINLFGGGKTRVSSIGYSALYPAWSPDGREIAYVSDASIGWEIYVFAIAGGTPVQLTQREPQSMISDDLRNSLPAWSPDGQYLAYASARDGNAEIYAMKAGGSEPVNLTRDPGYDGFPDWASEAGGPQRAAATPAPQQAGGVKLDDPNAACAVHWVAQPQFSHDTSFLPELALSCLEKDGWHEYKTSAGDDPGPLAAWLGQFLPRPWPAGSGASQLPGWIAPCPGGRYYLLVKDQLYLLDGEKPVEIIPDGYERPELPACGPGGDLWVKLAKKKPRESFYVPPYDPHKGYKIDPNQGVSHFDGAAWKHYPVMEFFGEHANWINSIAFAPDGRAWLAAASNISVFDGAQWKNYETGKDFASKAVDRMVFDSKGKVWAITESGLVAYDGQKWTQYEEGTPHYIYYASQMAVDAQDRIWIAIDYQKQIYRFDPRANRWDLVLGEKEFNVDTFLGMQFDRQGRLWLSTADGLFVYDGSRLTQYRMSNSGLYANGVYALLLFGDGPALVEPAARAGGSIRGRLINPDPGVFEKVHMEICTAKVGGQISGYERCTGWEPAEGTAEVAAGGSFVFKDVPAGRYNLVIKAGADVWVSDLWIEVKPGQTTETGQSSYPPGSGTPVVPTLVLPTLKPLIRPTAPVPTAAPSSTPVAAIPTLPPPSGLSDAFRLVTHETSFPAFGVTEMWLEFLIPPGQTLDGAVIEAYLAAGTLEITLPGGEKLALAQVPSPDEIRQLGVSTFENYSETPGGPQIRVAIAELVSNPAKGQYQISWRSGNLVSNTIRLQWDGSTVRVIP